jgi:hypothetical protein
MLRALLAALRISQLFRETLVVEAKIPTVTIAPLLLLQVLEHFAVMS